MTELTFTIDANDVARYNDEFLAFAWWAAQHNPAPTGDEEACNLVEVIGTEIIRRWLSRIQPELYVHKPSTNYWSWLTLFAKYQPPAGASATPGDKNTTEWHRGRWVARTPEELAEELASRERTGRHPATAVRADGAEPGAEPPA